MKNVKFEEVKFTKNIKMMSTAEILYQQYRALPPQIQKELKALIENDEKHTLIEQIESGLKDVKMIKDGKLPRRTFQDLKFEMANE